MRKFTCPRCGGENLKWAPHRPLSCASGGWASQDVDPVKEKLTYAQFRWIEALRNGTDYDAVYWQGVVDGLEMRLRKDGEEWA